MRVGIIAAMPAELKPLVRGWEESAAANGARLWTHRANANVWVAACSGMGGEAATRAFAAAEEDGPLGMVLSVGFAGAVIPDLVPGEARALSHIVDEQTGEQFHLTDGKRLLTLISTNRVVGNFEKARLRRAYRGAVMVDMEAATVARLAEMRGIPIACIKGVSDDASARLPDFNRFLSPAGKMRMLPFLLHLALQPKYWGAVAQLARNSNKAAQAVADIVLQFMEEKNVERLNRTGSP